MAKCISKYQIDVYVHRPEEILFYCLFVSISVSPLFLQNFRHLRSTFKDIFLPRYFARLFVRVFFSILLFNPSNLRFVAVPLKCPSLLQMPFQKNLIQSKTFTETTSAEGNVIFSFPSAEQNKFK